MSGTPGILIFSVSLAHQILAWLFALHGVELALGRAADQDILLLEFGARLRPLCRTWHRFCHP